MNVIKRIWKRPHLLLLDFGLPVFGLLLMWRLLGLIFVTNLSLNEFEATSGKIESVKVIDAIPIGRFRETDHHLIINLVENGTTFRLHDQFSYKFKEILNTLSTGDQITLYYLGKTSAFKYMLRPYDLYRIDKVDITVFELDWMIYHRKEQIELIAFMLVATIVGYTLHRYTKSQRRGIR